MTAWRDRRILFEQIHSESKWCEVNIESIKTRCVISESGCWEWSGALASGYGRIKLRGVNALVHREVFRIENPDKDLTGLDVCHTCDNRKCCNPMHLFLGTRSDNMQDCSRKKRLAAQNGKHIKPKCGPEFIPLVRKLRADGTSKRKVAVSIGLSFRAFLNFEKRHFSEIYQSNQSGAELIGALTE